MLKYLFIFLLTRHFCHGGTFEALGDSTECEKKCSMSFPPHTYPHGDHDDACQRGCRFYIIDKLVDSSDANSSVKEYCYNSCIEAYNETSILTVACNTGCDVEELISLKEKDSEDEQHMHLLTPFMQVQEVASKIVGMFHIVKTSVTTYFRSEDNKVVAVKEPVSVMVDIVPLKEQDDFEPDFSNLQDKPNEILAEKKLVPRKYPFFSLHLATLFLFAICLFTLFLTCFCSKQKVKKDLHVNPPPRASMHIKLVRPEDLTKLSLMDEDTMEAGPLPLKVKLPDSSTI